MGISQMPKVLTPSEAAEYLRVDEATVLKELESGSLNGFKIGPTWRCTDVDLAEYVSRGRWRTPVYETKLATQIETETVSDFTEVDSFDFGWPRKGGGLSYEHFDKVYETTRRIKGHTHTFKIGFAERWAAGQNRRRVVVWLGNRPLVEFTGGNNFEADGLMSSVIKLENGRQLWPSEAIPAEYQDFDVRRYDSIVQGRYASTNMAIVVHEENLESMLRHAIVRAQWKKLI